MEGYFDFAAACPMDDDAMEAYLHAANHYYENTRSLHDGGTKAAALLEHCRQTLADLMVVEKEGLYFTSGGSESNERAIEALLTAREGKHIVTTDAEHSSVRNIIRKYEREGYKVTRVPLTEEGLIEVEAVEKVVGEETVLLAVQHVNSDIGTIQPLHHLSAICRKYNILLHTDCVQSFGKIRLDEIAPYVDSLSVAAHKLYGPKGVGAMYIRPSLTCTPRTPGGAHERGMRPGTINLPGIAAFTVSAEKMVKEISVIQRRIITLKQAFLDMGEWHVLGDTVETAVPILGLILPEIEGQLAMLEGNRNGYYFSTGSACHADDQKPAATLLAMGYSAQEAKSFIRLSFSHHHKVEQVVKLAGFLKTLRGKTVATGRTGY